MLTTGFASIDKIISKDEIVEFYSSSNVLIPFYHRVIALSAPVFVVIVSERGGLDPYLIKRFQHVFSTHGEVYLRRAFKPEDVPPTIESMNGHDLIIIDPYHHRKNYNEIISSIRKLKIGTKKFIFSFMDREKEGSIFGLHSTHSLIKIEREKGGFRFIIKKSITTKEMEIPSSIWNLYGKIEESEGLVKWL